MFAPSEYLIEPIQTGTVGLQMDLNATPFQWIDPQLIPKREWLYGVHFIRKFVSATIAPGGIGKSSLLIVEALAMASGRPLLGVRPPQRLRVWLWNGEDPIEELQRRVMAAAKYFGLTAEDLNGWLFVDSGRSMPVILAEQNKTGMVVHTEVTGALIAEIQRKQIDVLIVDPFVSCHHVVENDNNAIDAVVKQFASIADRTRCAIDLVHHSRKTGGNEITTEDGRGASSLLAAARSARVCNPMREDDAEKLGIEKRRRYFQVTNGKANLAPPPDQGDWYELNSVPLGNGDEVAVVSSWTRPDPMAQFEEADLTKALETLKIGDWRVSNQAKEWAGRAIADVFGWDVNDPRMSRRLAGILKALELQGRLIIEYRKDNKGKTSPYYRVAGQR